MTKLSTQMPRDHGLPNRDLVKDPDAVRVVLALVDVSKTTTDTDSGDIEATVRVLRVEVITDADLPAAQKILRHAIEKRTGAVVLDGFEDDLDQDIKKAFGGAS